MFYQTPLSIRHTKDFSFKPKNSKQEDLSRIVSHRDKLYQDLLSQNEKQIELEKEQQQQDQVIMKNSHSTHYKTLPQSPYHINRSLSQIEKNKDTIKQQISFLNSQIHNSQTLDSQLALSPQRPLSTLHFSNHETEEKQILPQEKELLTSKQLNDQTIHIKQLQLQNEALQRQLEQQSGNTTTTTVTKQLFPKKKKKTKQQSKNPSLTSAKSQSSLQTSLQSQTQLWKKQKEVAKISEEVKQKFKSKIGQARDAIKILEGRNEQLENQVKSLMGIGEEKQKEVEMLQREKDAILGENDILVQENQKLIVEITGLKEEMNLELERKTMDIEKCADTIKSLAEQLREQQKLNEVKEIEVQEQQKQITGLKDEKDNLQRDIKNLIAEMQHNQSTGTLLNSQYILQELSLLDQTFTNNIINNKDNKEQNHMEKELLNIIKQLKQENDDLNHNLVRTNKKIQLIKHDQENQERKKLGKREFDEDFRLKSMIMGVQDKNAQLRRQLADEMEYQERVKSVSPFQQRMQRRYQQNLE